MFFAARIDLFKLEVKIVNDIGDWIVIQGEDCRELPPYYGIELDEGEQLKLTKWLNEHGCN